MSATTFATETSKAATSFLRFLMPTPKPQPVRKPVTPAPKPPPSDAKKILIVDDDAVVLETTSLKLQSHGYAVVTASDPPGALRTARREKPDLILLDLTFPPDVGMVAWDGYLLMSWLRRLEEAREIPIIIITGNASSMAKDRALAAGAMGIFQKPLEPEGLAAAIKLALRTGQQPTPPASVSEFEI
ncbi:Response regulator receiver protein [Verrucomicrobia bacterium]|nr:Response regulator receiver protein [Verrucomicrobiota bacterium]